jgi:hypothetical protein
MKQFIYSRNLQISRLMKLLFLSFFVLKAYSQNFSNGFNFYLPPYDTADTRFIPQFPKVPLTDQDFVSIDTNGHFSVHGAPIHFWGLNETIQGKDIIDLPSIVGRIRKMGFNLIRYNLLDGPWTGYIFDKGADTRHLNPVSLDNFDKVISEFKENGIYTYISLLDYRKFLESDGVQGADSIALNLKIGYGPFIAAMFDPHLIFLQKEYARQLLLHHNPYTGDSLVNDPVMAVLEIHNEDYMYRFWRRNQLQLIGTGEFGGLLIYRHVRMLDSLWNDYLLKKYPTSEALKSAWNQGTYPDSRNQIRNGSFGLYPNPYQVWELCCGPIHATWQVVSPIHYAKIVDTQENGTVFFRQRSLSVKKDSLYVLRFRARAKKRCKFSFAVKQDFDPWDCFGPSGRDDSLTTEWQVFTCTFRATETCIETAQLLFTFNEAGEYYLDNVTLFRPGIKGLLPDEKYGQSVRRISYRDCSYDTALAMRYNKDTFYSEQRIRDMSDFYISLQRNFFSEMSRFLKDTLHVRVPIVGTNMNIYPGDLVMESGCDFVDTHTYYGDSTDDNMILSRNGGAIGWTLAGRPMKNKPFTISEFGIGWPNRYQSEGPLVMSAYSSFHDIDGLVFHCYSGMMDWETDIIEVPFASHRNSALMALMPSCAYAYRHGLISKAKQTVYLNYCKDDYLLFPKIDRWWPVDPEPFNRTIALNHAVRTDSFESTTPINYASISTRAGSSTYVSDTRELTWNTDGLLSVGSGKFAGFTGLLNNFPLEWAGPIRLCQANGFGTITWLSLTEDSLQKAERSLLTISTRAQNTGMVWSNGEVLEKKFGTSPTQVEPLKITLLLSIEADSIRVHPLDTLGGETNGYYTYYPWPNLPNLPNPPSNILHPPNFPSRPTAFLVDIDQSQSKTMWFGIERFKNNVKPTLNSRTPNTLSMVCQDNPQTFSVDVTSPTGLPVRYQWKVNGITMQTSARSYYTVIFREQYNKPMSVTVVFSVNTPAGVLKDSTTWNFRLAGKIVVDGEKDDFFNTLTSPGDGYLQIRSYASFNENGIPSDDNDLSANVWTAWDDQWFYLYEEVKDNILSGNLQHVYDEDCLELKIDPQPTDAESNSIWEARLTALGIEEPGVVAADNLNDLLNSRKQWKRVRTDDGYKLELAIKWTAIQSDTETITPAVGNVFGLAINQHDNDGNGSHHATVQWAAFLSNEVYHVPSFLGTVTFLPDHKLKFEAKNNIIIENNNPIPYDGSDYSR